MFEDDIKALPLTQIIESQANQEHGKVLLTILALFVLKRKYAHKGEEWQLIFKKSKDYLKEVGIVKVEKMLAAIEATLK